MNSIIGKFKSARWGEVTVERSNYGRSEGPLAIMLFCDNGTILAVLSVNMYTPECSKSSAELPEDCFYVKTWGENEELAEEARTSGLFIERPDLGEARSGWVEAPVWQLKKEL